MASLTGSSIASSYTSLLKLNGNTDNIVAGNDSNAIQIVDGDGTGSPLYLNTDRLGIGGQPSEALDVTGNGKISGNILSSDKGIITNASGEFSAYATSGNMLKLGANGSDAHLQIDTNGHISATGIKSYLAFYDNDGSTLAGYVGSGQDMAFGDANDLCIRGADSIKFTANNGNADAMTIDSSANVGIGTTSPKHYSGTSGTVLSIHDSSYRGILELSGASNSDDGVIGAITFANTENDADKGALAQIYTIVETSDSNGGDDSGGHLAFLTRPEAGTLTERMRIDSNGKTRITASTAEVLSLRSSDTNGSHIIFEESTTARGYVGIAGSVVTSGGDNFVVRSEADLLLASGGNNIRMVIDANSRISLSNNDSSGEASSTFLGYQAGNAIASGATKNLAIGHQALYQADACDDSIAIGYQALAGTDTGTNNRNVAIGTKALHSNLLHSFHNIAIGYESLLNATGITSNVAIGGSGAGKAITTADRIVAIGDGALGGAAQSDGNTGVGYATLYNATGAKNTAFGYQASDTITDGTENTVVGWDADVTGSGAVNQTVIGSETNGVADNSVTLGNGDVTAVYMASDKGATIFASGATFEDGASQTTINLKATANNYVVGLSNSSGRIDLRPGGTTALTAINNGNVSVTGALSKGSGSFKIDHPLESKEDTHHLVHSFVEAPKADNIYRGRATLSSGSVEINLDTVSGMSEGTFVLLNTDIQCFTSNESDWDAVKGSVSGNILTISCQNTDSTANVSWLVIGERQDDHIKETDWTDENGKVIVEPEKNN